MILPMTLRQAAAPGAPLVHRDALGNVCLDLHFGDVEKVSAAFAEATHVTRLSLRNNRIIVCPMEPCGAIDEYNAEQDRLILRLGCQGVFGQRSLLSSVMGVPVEKLHVRAGNVGGSFGMKASACPEYICLLHAARTLREPVKWIDERSESFMSDSHGRDHEMLAELALDVGGKLRALRVTDYGNLGAWLSNATTIPPTLNTVKNTIGVFATPLIQVSTKCLFTNTDTRRGVSRSRTAGGQLLHGASGRNRGARNGHQQGRVTPPQPHPAAANALQGAFRDADDCAEFPAAGRAAMIEPTELIGLRLSSDRTCLRLRVLDQSGQTVTVSLPVSWLNRVLSTLPQTSGPDAVYPLDSWSMARLSNGQDLVLMLRTQEGQAVSFAMKPQQVEGMAQRSPATGPRDGRHHNSSPD